MEAILEQGLDVVVVFHSLGGVLGPQALKGFWRDQRREELGKHNGIIGMVYSSCPIVPKAGITSQENQAMWGSDAWFGGNPKEAMEFVRQNASTPSACLSIKARRKRGDI